LEQIKLNELLSTDKGEEDEKEGNQVSNTDKCQVSLKDRWLPSDINLCDGHILILLWNVPRWVMDTQRHRDEHSKIYADMFLYIPWQDEERLFGDARRSLDVCQAKWEEWWEAALDMKNQLKQVVKESWLS
jgi:hypothetical protein